MRGVARLTSSPVLPHGQFLDLCLLVGCDYITATVKGLGMATAHKLVERHRSLDKVPFRGDWCRFVRCG